MKTLFVLLVILCSSLGFGQVSGEIINDHRPIIKDIVYEVNGRKQGTLAFTISVNEKGDVISCKLDKENSTVYDTPASVAARNQITSGLKFKADSSYPKFHHGTVWITVLKR